MDDNDFIQAFVGANILSVEACGKVIGAAMASIYTGMTEAGLNPLVAQSIIHGMWKTFFDSINQAYGPSLGNGGIVS